MLDICELFFNEEEVRLFMRDRKELLLRIGSFEDELDLNVFMGVWFKKIDFGDIRGFEFLFYIGR